MKSAFPARRPEADQRPSLGALLRLAHQSMNQELARWLTRSDYADLQPAHCAAIQALWSQPDGARLTVLAQLARITKQSMGALVDHLGQTGYVERVDDPDDRRASRVRLTARGRAFGRNVRAFAQGVEAEWAKRVGARRIRELRSTLERLVVAAAPPLS